MEFRHLVSATRNASILEHQLENACYSVHQSTQRPCLKARENGFLRGLLPALSSLKRQFYHFKNWCRRILHAFGRY